MLSRRDTDRGGMPIEQLTVYTVLESTVERMDFRHENDGNAFLSSRIDAMRERLEETRFALLTTLAFAEIACEQCAVLKTDCHELLQRNRKERIALQGNMAQIKAKEPYRRKLRMTDASVFD